MCAKRTCCDDIAVVGSFAFQLHADRIVFKATAIIGLKVQFAKAKSFVARCVMVAEQTLSVGQQTVELTNLLQDAKASVQPLPMRFVVERLSR